MKHFLFGLLLIVGLFIGSAMLPAARAVALARQPSPTAQDNVTSDRLRELTESASNIVTTFISAVQQPLGKYFDNLAYILAYFITLVFFMRLLRQGGSADEMYWALIRLVCCFILLGACAYREPGAIETSGAVDFDKTDLTTYIGQVGNAFAYGEGGDNNSLIGRNVERRRLAFSNGYSEFVANEFTYRINDENRLIQYPDDATGGEQVMAVDSSTGDSIRKVAGALTNERGWSMDKLFQYLNMARGIVEFGDLFLLILNGFLIAAIKLSAPFMIAVSIDREFASRIGKNFAWGALVVLVIMPFISQLVRFFAYTAGAIPFGKVANPYFVYDATSGNVIVHGNPEYMIIISAALMTICGLCMFASPFISYKIAQGGVFEAVAGTVSGWMGAMIGTGISMWSSATGANINKQAADISSSAQAQGDTQSAAGAQRSELISANAHRSATEAQSRGDAVASSSTAWLEANAASARADIAANRSTADAQTTFGEAQINNEAERRSAAFGTEQQLGEAKYDQFYIGGGVAKGLGDTVTAIGNSGGLSGQNAAVAPVAGDALMGAKVLSYFAGNKDSATASGSGGGAPHSSSSPYLGANGKAQGGEREFVPALNGNSVNDAIRGAGANPNQSSCAYTGNGALKNLGLIPKNAHTSARARESMDDLQSKGGWQKVNPQEMQAGDAVFFVGKNWGKAKYPDMNGAGVHQMTATGHGTVSGSPGHGLKFERNAYGMQRSMGGEMVVLRSPQLAQSAASANGRSVMIPEGNRAIFAAPFPVQKALMENERAAIKTGGGDAAARIGYERRSGAAWNEAASLKGVAVSEAQGKQSIAWSQHGSRMNAAGIEHRGASQSAEVRFEASSAAIKTRHEAAMKAANLNAAASVISSFGSTIASQAQGAMQQYNRF